MIDFCSAILLPLNGFIFIQKKEIRNWFFYFREYITTSIIFSNPSFNIDIDFSHTQPCIESTCTFQNIIHERLSISMSIMSGNICLHKWPLFFTNKNDNINETQRDIPTSDLLMHCKFLLFYHLNVQYCNIREFNTYRENDI